jgi:hypothetical protein
MESVRTALYDPMEDRTARFHVHVSFPYAHSGPNLMDNVSHCSRSAVIRLFSLKIEFEGQRKGSNTFDRISAEGL